MNNQTVSVQFLLQLILFVAMMKSSGKGIFLALPIEILLVQLQVTVSVVDTSAILISIIGMQCVHAESYKTEDLFRHCGSMMLANK